MPMKAAIGFYLTPIKMAIIKTIKENKCSDIEKRESSHIVGEIYVGHPLQKSVWKFLRVLEIDLP